MMALLKPCRILCIGDVMLDRFIYGQVERISPESPIPILHVNKSMDMLGGAGNVARNLASLNAEVEFISLTGNDDAASLITKLISFEPKIYPNVLVDDSRQTIVKSRFIAQGQQLLRVDLEKTHPASEDMVQNILQIIEKKLENIDAVIISDYAKGLLVPNLVQGVIKLCAKKVPVIVDPKGKNYSLYQGATFIAPNLKELKDVTQYPINSQNDVIEAAKQLRDLYSIEHVLVTQGSEGMTLVSENSNMHITAQAREVYDVSGAGDTVVAVLAIALASGNTPEVSCKLANIAAGIVVGKVGTATVNTHELLDAYQFSHEQRTDKVYTLPKLLSRVEEWRKEGYKVGFTNGCFDLLHQGHLHILRSSAAECDRLIIGLNTDQSVKGLKGESRPIHDEGTRAEVLASLYMVDAVILFDEETPLNLIQNILPEVLIKGADYTIDRVVGADVVINNGGKVHLVELKQGHSTTKTVANISS